MLPPKSFINHHTMKDKSNISDRYLEVKKIRIPIRMKNLCFAGIFCERFNQILTCLLKADSKHNKYGQIVGCLLTRVVLEV